MATPSLAMIPSAYADSKVYSVLPNNGDGDFSFNRDSSATRIGQNGLIQEVGFFGNELVTNGDFATDSDWTKSTGVSISSGICTFTSVLSIGSVRQGITSPTGKTFKVTYEILSITSGGYNITLNGNVNQGTTRTATGIYSEKIIAGALTSTTFGIHAVGTTSGTIDNISVQEVTGDQPRLNYDISNGVVQSCPSLLLEPASTNLVTTSETLSNYWSVQGATLIVDNQAVNPTGSLYANKLNTSNTAQYRGLNNAETTSYDGKTLNVSVFAKKITNDYIYFYNIGSTSGSSGVWFNISNGTLGNIGGAWSNAKIEDYGNGWYRCSATVTFGTNTNYLYLLNSDGNDNKTSTIGSQTYLWGSQVEEQSYATSYIPTNGSSQTRAAETCNGAGTSSTFNSTEGVLYAEISGLALAGGDSRISLSDSTLNNRISFAYSPTASKGYIIVKINGVSVINNLNVEIGNHLDIKKIAISYKSGDTKVFLNGVELSIASSVSFSGGVLNDLSFESANSSVKFYGNVKDIRVYNEALTDAQLQTLTTL